MTRMQNVKSLLEDLRGKTDAILSDAQRFNTLSGPRSQLSAAFRDALQAVDTVEQAARDAHEARMNQELRPDVIQQRVEERVGEARTQATDLVDAAESSTTQVVTTLEAMATPPRPEPVDERQEAELASLKTDLRMVLDGTPADALVPAMVDLAEHYRGPGPDRNALAVWLLAGSDWPWLYFKSRSGERDAEPYYQNYKLRVAKFLADDIGEDQTLARRLLMRIAGDGKDNLGSAIAFQLRPAVNARLDELARPPQGGTAPAQRMSNPV